MEAIKREYNLTNADLAALVGNFIVYMNRDSTELATRGVTATDITDFETLGNAFEVFPPDVYYQAQVTAEVDAKNNARESSYDKIQLISGFFEQEWGINSWQYKQLGIKGLSKASDNNYLVLSRNVVTVAGEQLSNLTGIGLTQADIDGLNSELQTMEDKLHAIKEKQALRDSKTQERTQKGNELYEYLKKYSIIGKLVWENVDEAKYNDYIIYKTVHSGLSKPQNLQAIQDVTNPSLVNLSWEFVLDATEYDIYVNIEEIGSPSGTFNLLNTVSITGAQVPAVANKRNYFKIRAKNPEKTSDYSDEVFVDIGTLA